MCSAHIISFIQEVTMNKEEKSKQTFDYNIALIGFMGSGKSTVSQALNQLYAMDVIEMDQVIADREGMSISEIFKKTIG